MKRRLLIVASTFPRWPNDINAPFVYELAKRLQVEFEVSVLAPHYPGAKQFETMDGMNVYRFRYFFEKWEKLAGSGGILPALKKNKFYYIQVPFFIFSEFFALWKLADKINPHIIHAHWIISQGLVAVLYQKLLGRKMKIVITALGGDLYGIRFADGVKKWVVNNCSALAVVSTAMRTEVETWGMEKDIPVEVIPMGVDFSEFSPKNYDASIKRKYSVRGPLLLFVGRLSEKKGAKYLIDAMPAIVANFPETKLLIVGDGEEKDSLVKQANDLTLFDKNIFFVGSVPHAELAKYYATADIFIGPSVVAKGGDTEGLPVAYLEAVGSGGILIGSDLEGNKDVIREGVSGFFVKQKDAAEISDRVIKVLNNRNLIDSMRKTGREYVVERFDWSCITKKYQEIFK